MSLVIRPMRPVDADQVGALHLEGIPQGFLSQLGAGVRAQLYRGIANAHRSGVWVAEKDGMVIGFISGTANVSSCYRSVLLRRGLGMAWFAVPALFRPSTWKQIIETLLYPKREIESVHEGRDDRSPDVAPEPTAELLSIVVAPAGRGTGAAAKLVEALEEALLSWNHRGAYRVVTMAADPRSNGFYQKVGFRHVREFHHHGVAMNLYHKGIST